MKIGFITDTNILRKNEDKISKASECFSSMDIFIEYIKSLRNVPTDKKLIYFMPNIILEELYYQMHDNFTLRYTKFYQDYMNLSYGLIGDMPENNIKEILKAEKEKYEREVEVIELPYSIDIFKKLVDDALKKNAPFDKSLVKQKTDAGFKDALIWTTIMYSNKIDCCDKLYFFSGDKIFDDKKNELKHEFLIKHPNVEISLNYIPPEGNQRQECLQKIINENGLIKTDIIKLYDLDLILKYIKEIRYNNNKEVYYYDEEKKLILKDILFKDFDKGDIKVEKVEEENSKYNITIYFKTCKYIILDDNSTKNKKLEGKIKFILLKNQDRYIIDNYKIFDIIFETNFIETMDNMVKEIGKIFIDDVIKKAMPNANDIVNLLKENLGENLTDIISFKEVKNTNAKINQFQTMEKENKKIRNNKANKDEKSKKNNDE